MFAIFRQFLDNPPLFMENLPKKGPLFREFGAKKPAHIGGTYPYPQHVMYPPPPGILHWGLAIFLVKSRKQEQQNEKLQTNFVETGIQR